MSLTGIPDEVQERIRQAAEVLYEGNERTALPTVDQVRRHTSAVFSQRG